MLKPLLFLFIFTCFYQNLSAQGDYVSLGIGPSLLYSDNAGEYRAFKFKVQPSVTLSVSKQLSEFIAVRASVGSQMFNSGGFDPLNTGRVVNWGNKDQAYDFKGLGYFGDIMPVLTTNPNAVGMVTASYQFYMGLGFGMMYIQRDEKTLKNGVIFDRELIRGTTVESKESSYVGYVPLRTGINTNLSGNWDYSLEFTLITMMGSDLDGNNVQTKLIKPDMIGQVQIKVSRYFGMAW